MADIAAGVEARLTAIAARSELRKLERMRERRSGFDRKRAVEALGAPRSCSLCGTALERADAELDHAVPVQRGGSHHVANLQWAHRSCNRAKGEFLWSEVLALAFGLHVMENLYPHSPAG